jgi:hypothetical protein
MVQERGGYAVIRSPPCTRPINRFSRLRARPATAGSGLRLHCSGDIAPSSPQSHAACCVEGGNLSQFAVIDHLY